MLAMTPTMPQMQSGPADSTKTTAMNNKQSPFINTVATRDSYE
jgi:hypothetical protein